MLSELRPEAVAAAKASFRAVWDADSRIAHRHTVNVAAFLLIL